jgi:hypothetical protein
LSRAVSRFGYRELSPFDIPSNASLATDIHERAGRRILKLERDTVVWCDAVPSEGVSVVFKMYRNRDCVSVWRERAFRFRVEREYNSLHFLSRHDIPCSIPRYWTFGVHQDHGRYEILCMDEIPNVTELVPEFPSRSPGWSALDRLKGTDFTALCGLIRRMHAAGFYHGRLDLRNILVGADDAGAPAYCIIDTPQAMVFPYDIWGTRTGWDDLRHFAAAMRRHLGPDACDSVLVRYGLDPAMRARMLQDISRGGRPRLGRNFTRFEFGVRSRLARLARRTTDQAGL